MHITKFGHSCLLVEEGGVKILVDPGSYSTGQNQVRDTDVVLITHEHRDHLDVGSVKAILEYNPKVKIITGRGAGALLGAQGIAYQQIEDGEYAMAQNVLIEAFGKDHALIHSSIPIIENTGFFVAERFFYPGDAFVYPYVREALHAELVRDTAIRERGSAIFASASLPPLVRENPLASARVGLPKPVEILALPVNAPWMRIAEAIDYAIELKPKVCIPVHDGLLKNVQTAHGLPKQILEPMGIEVRVLAIGDRVRF